MSSVDDLAWHLADHDDSQPPGPAGASREGAPVGLSEAVTGGIVPLTLAAIRKARERDPEFPQPVARLRGERLYDRGELIDWHAVRAAPVPERPTVHLPVPPHGSPVPDAARPTAGPTKREREQLAEQAAIVAERDRLAGWWAALGGYLDNEATDDELLGVAEQADKRDGGRDCPTCGEPMHWAGGYTSLICRQHRPLTWRRAVNAERRGIEHAQARAPRAAAGPNAAERSEVAEAACVALDDISGVRELLEAIPRGDPWRHEARRALHKLAQLEQLYKDAASYAALDTAAAGDVRLFGDAEGSTRGELAEILEHAERLAEQRARAEHRGNRRASSGMLLRLLAGERGGQDGDDDGEIVDAELLEDDDRAPELDSGEQPRALPAGTVPGFNPPDPNWRDRASAAELAYWDHYGAPALSPRSAIEPPPEHLALTLRYGRPFCQQCLDGGNRNPPAAVARVLYNGLREWDVCTGHERDMRSRGISQLIARYEQPTAAPTFGGALAERLGP